MLGLISLLMTGVAAVLGFSWARRFVRRRLTYVDAVQQAYFPIIVGTAAAVLAMPITWIVPLIGGGTAILFGASVAFGTAAGAKEIRRKLYPG